MWIYEKKLQIPVNITTPNIKLANSIMTQFGGPNGELAASLRYLTQRINIPTSRSKGLLNDIGTEELAHLEVVQAIIYQLTNGATPEDYLLSGLQGYYAVWDNHLFPASPTGEPFTSAYINNTGDAISCIHEDLAAEEKARVTYEQLLNLTNDPQVAGPLSFLREREVVHFQRFGELLDDLQFDQNIRKQFTVTKPVNKDNIF